MLSRSISCICPTFNRIETLEESVESFLRQDYAGKKELIIINDFKKHKLVFDHPEIKIVDSTADTLGGIMNEAILKHASYDVIAVWEDDDIYLPNSLTVRSNQLNGVECAILTNAIMSTGSDHNMNLRTNTFHGQMIFTKNIFNVVGGYPETWHAHDIKFIDKIPKENIKRVECPLDGISYIYRWSNGQQNLSSLFHHNDPTIILSEIMKFRQLQIDENEFKTIPIKPKWNHAYEEMAKECIEENKRY